MRHLTSFKMDWVELYVPHDTIWTLKGYSSICVQPWQHGLVFMVFTWPEHGLCSYGSHIVKTILRTGKLNHMLSQKHIRKNHVKEEIILSARHMFLDLKHALWFFHLTPGSKFWSTGLSPYAWYNIIGYLNIWKPIGMGFKIQNLVTHIHILLVTY